MKHTTWVSPIYFAMCKNTIPFVYFRPPQLLAIYMYICIVCFSGVYIHNFHSLVYLMGFSVYIWVVRAFGRTFCVIRLHGSIVVWQVICATCKVFPFHRSPLQVIISNQKNKYKNMACTLPRRPKNFQKCSYVIPKKSNLPNYKTFFFF
jgi:hypothetical protein